ncbi:transcription termination/antitermination protein NusG [Candidatus Methylacidithermus pantelleriae]|uniref:Transcription termination/antitermination protein NusG n=1 Tax=Candidatus Methylacidithermus pantelleriae TaxID=2744239 RepID=A0A8J2FMK3_9BACT|nr:transcription termination/antitermination NusG family protein [Candidatus Methylacidithermus pantelleriae]CAF0689084.1 Transcription termination/antitermination protein NusG [Candidatus Methylacidithermus pantelleriae]
MEYAAAQLPDLAYWFCVRTQPRREFLACRTLARHRPELEVFCPRIRYRKTVRRRLLSVIEPLFPGYLFAWFNPVRHLRLVLHTQGVGRVVCFGDRYPVVEAEVIEELKAHFGEEGVQDVELLKEGDRVIVHHGALQGLEAVLSKLLPGEARVRILMEFLGRQMELELPVSAVAPAEPQARIGWLRVQKQKTLA